MKGRINSMHIPDGILSVPVWATLNAVAIPGIGLAVRRARKHLAEGHVPLLGVMGAFVFAAQRMNFPEGSAPAPIELCRAARVDLAAHHGL